MKILRNWYFLSKGEKVTVLLILVLIISVVGMVINRCSTPTADYSDWFDEDKTNGDEFWPFSEGNYWHYQSEGEDIGDEVMVTVVAQDGTQAGDAQYLVEFDYETHSTVEHYSYDEEGLLWHGVELPMGTYQRQPPQHLVKFPTNEAHQWNWRGGLHCLQGTEIDYRGEAQIEQDTLEKVELPVGRKEGIEVRHNMMLEIEGEQLKVEETRVYVPEIGLVKQEVVENGEVQLKKLLIDYASGGG